MKILHVTYCFAPDAVGGTEIYVEGLCGELAALGVECVVAAPSEARRDYEWSGIRVRRFEAGPVTGLEELYGGSNPRAAADFARLLTEEAPDAVHFHAKTRAVSTACAEEARRRGIRVIFTYHTPTVACQRGTLMRWGKRVCDGAIRERTCAACVLQSKGIAAPAAAAIACLPAAIGAMAAKTGWTGRAATAVRMRSLMRRRKKDFAALAACVDRFVAVCGWGRDVLERNGVPPGNILVSRHGLTRVLEAAAGREKPQRLAFFGRLHPTKGVALAIRAILAVPNAPGLDVYGVVQGPEDEAHARFLRGLAGADPRVRFLEGVPHARVVERMAGYAAVVVPSQWLETGPLVVLEAFAAGVPVVGSRLGGIAELVTHGKDGFLVDRFDSPDAWTRAVSALDARTLAAFAENVNPPRTMAQAAAEIMTLYERPEGVR